MNGAARLCVALTALVACAPSAPPPLTPPAARLPTAAEAAPPATVVPEAVAEPPAAIEASGPGFPPAPFTPPVERTAKPGDGTWAPLVAGAAGEPALLYRSMIHPDSYRPHIYVALVAIDLRRVAVHLVAGTREPQSASVPDERRPGLVPPAALPNLLAVMNGGFMSRHGGFGMKVGADVFAPAQPDGCTVALLASGDVRIRTWRELASSAADVVAYRQTPPCLVEQGVVHPALLGSEKPRRWGLSETGGIDIRRSALGVLEGGRTLVYGLGEGVTPRALAEAMRAAGAVDAAELDVNWSYTRFLIYRPQAAPNAPPEVKETLIPKIKHGPGQYVSKPAERDFFYLVRRR